MMSQADFEALADHAVDGVIAFADFARQTEHLFAESPDRASLEAYRSAWMELEIVNAIALDEWESEGRPASWHGTWTERFLKDAADSVDGLRDAARLLAT